MEKAAHNDAAGAALPLQNYTRHDMGIEQDSAQFMELVPVAFARLRHDLERYNPTKPAIAYALVGETHSAILHGWRQYPPATQAILLAALLEETTGLLHQQQVRIARVAPTNGYMYGQQDEAIKLETQADITMEEIHRIEAELRVLEAGEALQ
jgi:hypothetical protein